MPSKEFDAFIREATQEPITFTVAGETFTCIDSLPLTILANITRQQSNGQAVVGLADFLTAVVLPEDHDRLEVLMNEPHNAVAIESWAEIVEWLIEEYTGRPTRRRLSSLSGSSLNGASSRVASTETT